MTETATGGPTGFRVVRIHDLRTYIDDLANRHANDPIYSGKTLYAIRMGGYILGVADDSNVLMEPFFDNKAFTFEMRRIPNRAAVDEALKSTGHLVTPDGGIVEV